MKLCIVYSPKDSKLHSGAYCSVFRDMFFALVEKFNCKCFITKDCSAQDIDADVIFFFDPHATHHVKIDGIKQHPAIKIEYWNDIHQICHLGVFVHGPLKGRKFVKLGLKERFERTVERGTDYIVSAAKYYFYEQCAKYFRNNTEKILLYFPHAPKAIDSSNTLIKERKHTVLGNGARHGGWGNSYTLRTWAYKQPYIEFVEHCMFNESVPSGKKYMNFLSQYAGSLALCGTIPIPKYSEIPMAGCVTFAEHIKEYEELGFKDHENCIYVNKDNLKERIKTFLCNIPSYQGIADAGRKLMEENYTAKHFADFIFNHVERQQPKEI